MNFELLANLAEIIGGLAVIASLIYLAIQIRQNTKTVRAGTLANNTKIWSSMLLDMASGDKVEAYLLGSAGKEELSPLHFLQFMLLSRALYVSFENQFTQFSNGLMEEEVYLGYERTLRTQILPMPGFRLYWQMCREEFSPKFRDRIDQIIKEQPIADPNLLLRRWRALAEEFKTGNG